MYLIIATKQNAELDHYSAAFSSDGRTIFVAGMNGAFYEYRGTVDREKRKEIILPDNIRVKEMSRCYQGTNFRGDGVAPRCFLYAIDGWGLLCSRLLAVELH